MLSLSINRPNERDSTPRLTDLKKGQVAIITSIEGGVCHAEGRRGHHGKGNSHADFPLGEDLDCTKKLGALGLREGTTINMVSAQPFHGPIVIRVGTTDLALGYGMARKILVRPL